VQGNEVERTGAIPDAAWRWRKREAERRLARRDQGLFAGRAMQQGGGAGDPPGRGKSTEENGGDGGGGKRRGDTAAAGERSGSAACDAGDGARGTKRARGADDGEGGAVHPARAPAGDPGGPADDGQTAAGAPDGQGAYPWRLSSGPVVYKEYVDGVWVTKSAGESSFDWQKQYN